jgi:hypothetical protein
MVAVDLEGMHLMWRIHGFKLISASLNKTKEIKTRHDILPQWNSTLEPEMCTTKARAWDDIIIRRNCLRSAIIIYSSQKFCETNKRTHWSGW